MTTPPDRAAAADTTTSIRPDDALRLAENGPFGLAVTGPDDIIAVVNTTLLTWLGIDRDEVVGRKTLPDLLAPGDRIYHETHVRPMLNMGTGVTEIAMRFVRADGSRLNTLMSAHRQVDPVTGDARIETVVVDATERRRYEQELLAERKHAEDARNRLDVMYGVVSGFAGANTTPEIVDVVTERGEEWFNGATCAVWLLDEDRTSATRQPGRDDQGQAELSLESAGPALAKLADGELIVIEDTAVTGAAYPLIHQQLESAGRRSAVVAPLRVDDRLHGVMTYGFDAPHAFDDEERQSIHSLATQTEQALRRVLTTESERRSRGRLESAYRFGARMAEALTIDDVLGAITRASGDLVSSTTTRVATLDAERSAVRLVRSASAHGQQILGVDAAAIACAAIRTGEPVIASSSDDLRDRYPDSPILADGEFGAVIAVPLAKDDEILGAWTLAYPRPGRLDDDEITLLLLLADQASRAIDRATTREAEVAALARATVRLAVSEALNAAVTTDDVATAITTGGRNAFGASYLAVYVPSATDSMRRVAEAGAEERVDLPDTLDLADEMVAATIDIMAPTYLIGATGSGFGNTPFASMRWDWAVFLPLTITGRLDGLIVLGFDSIESLTPDARTALTGLTAEASTALARALRYDLEHEVASTLQRSLLPTELPTVPGWRISGDYSPGTDHLDVGGDFFDVRVDPNGDLVAVVGDVVGHGLRAAAAMGKLRSAARALALVCEGPLEVIRELTHFAAMTPDVKGATVACMRISPSGAGRYACAGHPYPLVVDGAGAAQVLDGGRCAMLGVATQPSAEAEFTLEPDSTLVLYTDGLVERRGTTIDDGIERLGEVAAAAQKAAGFLDADELIENMLRYSPADDDTVVVCISRLSAPPTAASSDDYS